MKDDHAGNDGRVASRLHHERLSEQLTGRHDYADSEWSDTKSPAL